MNVLLIATLATIVTSVIFTGVLVCDMVAQFKSSRSEHDATVEALRRLKQRLHLELPNRHGPSGGAQIAP